MIHWAFDSFIRHQEYVDKFSVSSLSLSNCKVAQLVERGAVNSLVAGSMPAFAASNSSLTQLVDVSVLRTECSRFDSEKRNQIVVGIVNEIDSWADTRSREYGTATHGVVKMQLPPTYLCQCHWHVYSDRWRSCSDYKRRIKYCRVEKRYLDRLITCK